MVKLTKFLKYYRLEIITEILAILGLIILDHFGLYKFGVSINSDGAFTIAALAFPISLVSYIRAKSQDREGVERRKRSQEKAQHQELYNTTLEKMWNLASFEDDEKIDDNILKLKLFQLSELYQSGRKPLSEFKSFRDVSIGIFFTLLTHGFRIDLKDGHKVLINNLEMIEHRIDENTDIIKKICFDNSHGKDNPNLQNIVNYQLMQIFKGLYWKNENGMYDLSKLSEEIQIFYKTKFDLTTKKTTENIQNLNKCLVIEPTFELGENTKKFHDDVQSTLDEDSVIEPHFTVNGKSYDSDTKQNEKSDIEALVMSDSRMEIINSRKEMKREYSKDGKSIVKFSTTYPSDDKYEWHSWFSFTNKRISSIKKDDAITHLKFVIDGVPFVNGESSGEKESVRIIVFTKEEFEKLIGEKIDFQQYSAPDFKKYFYFNYTDGHVNNSPELIDTRDIKDRDFIKIKLTDGKTVNYRNL